MTRLSHLKKFATVLLTFSAPVDAEDWTLQDRTVLTNVIVTEFRHDAIKVTHANGGGWIRVGLLPEDVRKKHAGRFAVEKGRQRQAEVAAQEAAKIAAAEKQRQEEAAAREKEARERAPERERGLQVKLAAVKEGKDFFRYFLSFRDFSGRDLNGELVLRYLTKDSGTSNGLTVLAIAVPSNDSSSGYIDWRAGPTGRHGENVGVRRITWTYATKSGEKTSGVLFSGFVDVPENPTGILDSTVRPSRSLERVDPLRPSIMKN